MINRTVLVGRLTKDPELRRTANDIAVTTFTLAVNRPYTSQSGDRDADFIPCVAWRRQAETVEKFLSKGSLVGVEGRIQTRSYDDQDGNRKYITEIVCDSVQFLDTKSSNDQSSQTPSSNQRNTSNNTEKEKKQNSYNDDVISEDDLPF